MSAARATKPRIEIAVAVVEHEGRLLIGQREAGAQLAGFWEFPGGKVEPHETPEAAAMRECLEETGLVVRVMGSYPGVEHDYEHESVRLRFFACAVEESQCALPARFRWVARGELADYQFPPANAALIERLR
jgi:8-oxo-dGTP diphosphatase